MFKSSDTESDQESLISSTSSLKNLIRRASDTLFAQKTINSVTKMYIQFKNWFIN